MEAQNGRKQDLSSEKKGHGECKEKEWAETRMEDTARGGTDIRRCGETIWDTVGAIRDGDEVRGR